MSARNGLAQKRLRRVTRAFQKTAAAREMPRAGVCIDSARTVKNHRYLRAHGLRHVPHVADIVIPKDIGSIHGEPVWDGFSCRRLIRELARAKRYAA